MDGKSSPAQQAKPFSVLEKFRQLKKDKEQPSTADGAAASTSDTSGNTVPVFQTLGLSGSSSNGDFGGGGGFRGRGFGRFRKGRGKRSFGEDTAERPPKRTKSDIWQGQKETDVGITEFIRSGPGFDVILKHRYTDFHVHEIDLEGNVTKLTSTEIPKEEVKLTTEEDPAVLSPEQWAELNKIVENQLSDTVVKDVTNLSKDERQRIHKTIKRRFGVHVYSNTKEKDGKKIILIGYGCTQKGRTRWPDGRPEYLHFLLHKENCETSEAISLISRHIGVKHTKFGYAGTKDKRAVTTQQMCLRRTEVERFGGCTEWRGISVGNFSYKWNNLRLGDLSGNRFKLVLRNVKASEEVVAEAVESLKTVGFINYFGMQRFGQSALVPTHLVGQAMLKGDWKLATELILKPRPGEASFWDVKEAREVWWETRDAGEALKRLGRKQKSIEGKILTGLRKHGPNAYQNAFDHLPHYTVTLYLHSYQSLVWNKIVSRRVKQFGLKVLPGDLVKISEPHDLDQQLFRWENEADCDSSEDEDEEETDFCSGNGRVQTQILSAEEAEKASIYDVVYPLPGDDVQLPNNEIAGWYEEIMESDGHSMSSFGKVNKKYGMYGAYRTMLEKVEDLNWNFQRYSDPDEDMLISDRDILKGKPQPVSKTDGPYKAIIIEFNLKTCCYATMAIRELAKCETSVVSQAQLTSQAREEDLASKTVKKEDLEKMETESEDKSDQICSTDINLSSENEVGDSKLKGNCEDKVGTEVEIGESSVKMEVMEETRNTIEQDLDTIESENCDNLVGEQSNNDFDFKGGDHTKSENPLDLHIKT